MSTEMMSEDTLAMVAGALLSLAFSYIPGLQQKYDPLAPTYKRLVMLGLLVVVAAAIFGIACTGWAAAIGIEIPCDVVGAIGLVRVLILAILANQSTYLISPKINPARNRGARA
jgi:hypothetical protein